ncbi:CHAD domain-containing protein [Altererythrobacter sp. KTW20L]|uniref:CYTH and CHAD domain-containing protein n=1 Tax=Altererythrobacter sp. KTW20L TaxID=2942210 RepID=UPI0020BEB468|nr:CHAD domain-containing protein [Altererythrobacter sp. KTW20L]MCL6250282.1 CHAD domain-containing protein [Altererythrobacter sp. KTW20L]
MTSGALEEVELKLELSSEAADALDAARLFGAAQDTVRQRTIYFDTPKHELAKEGLSLRIRRVGTKRVQTVKRDAGAAAGLFTRQEWECGVKDDHPLLEGSNPIAGLLKDRIADLAPVFAIENERRIWQVDGIEIAIDRGHIIAGERESFFCEVELEQKSGDFATLFALSRRIAKAAPVRLGVLSKAERGYRLLGPLPGATKAEPIVLAPDMTAAGAFQVIVRSCIRQFRLNEPLILENQDPEAVHQARVALRRLRSAFSIHRAMLTDERSAALVGEVRWLAGVLGEARDLDVLVERSCEGSLRERLIEERANAYTKAVHSLSTARSRKLMLDLAEWLAVGEWEKRPDPGALDLSVREVASAALDRYHRKVRKGGRCLEQLDDPARHEVRKAAKKLHYAADFFASLFVQKHELRRHRKFMQALKDLQDQLGALNDLATGPALLARLDLADHPQAPALFRKKDKHRLLAAAADSIEVLLDAKRFWR